MRDEYDFKDAKRGPVITPPQHKTKITIRIDTDTLEFFKTQVLHAGGGNYQTLINHALREYIQNRKQPLEDILRRVVREELSVSKTASKQAVA